MNSFSFGLVALLLSLSAHATRPDQKRLPIGLAPHEISQMQDGLRLERAAMTKPPEGEVRSLAEWEEAEAVMTLWPNASLLRELSRRGKVKLFGDGRSDIDWWKNYLSSHSIAPEPFSYFIVPTDSIWIRDYGPWFILDGNRSFGIVDNTYNRPRPQDDVVPEFLAHELSLPFFHTGLTHTGGNYYNDGMGNGFSSTLVYRENKQAKEAIDGRMRDFLGIRRYTTSPLGPGLTIEHLDTFGKLVAADTWVFADFPAGSRFKADADRMVEILKTQRSAYGTPYRILRMKMWADRAGDRAEDYRAYLNSFISNRAIYFPTYGNDEGDRYAAEVYKQALPGYDVVGVDGQNTGWGDSVHCRNRNLLQKNTIFLFPKITNAGVDGSGPFEIELEAIPTPGATLTEEPTLLWTWNGAEMAPLHFQGTDRPRIYTATLPRQSTEGHLSIIIKASDTTGKTKTVPPAAPEQQIRFDVPLTP